MTPGSLRLQVRNSFLEVVDDDAPPRGTWVRSQSADAVHAGSGSIPNDLGNTFDTISSVEDSFHHPGSPNWMLQDQATSCSTSEANTELDEEPAGSPQVIISDPFDVAIAPPTQPPADMNSPETNTSKAKKVLEEFLADYWQVYTTGCQIRQMLHQLEKVSKAPEVIDCCPVSWQPQLVNKEPCAQPEGHVPAAAGGALANEIRRMQQEEEMLQEAKGQYSSMWALLDTLHNYSHVVSSNSGID